MCVYVSVYEAATHLFSNKAQDGSIVMAPVLKNTTVGGNVTYNQRLNWAGAVRGGAPAQKRPGLEFCTADLCCFKTQF